MLKCVYSFAPKVILTLFLLSMQQHLLLGTAGHIDHGKTALVRALTGVDTDRLPDEKRRKITIDLGFAPLEIDGYSIGMIDVPGHEHFVKNMLAGAAGFDLALLIVAADDSVMPQTREHLDILRHLRLQTGLIVITKCDLVDLDWLELVEIELRELVQDTFLVDAPILRFSALTGCGLETLRSAISVAAGQVIERRDSQPAKHLRLAIDRVFTVAGHGTVVTGSVASGEIHVGDQLELQPLGASVRVRGLQSHDVTVETIGRGRRAAVNLAGIHYDEVSRGQSLVSCNTLQASRRLTVELQLSDQLSRPLKHRTAIRLHLGTASIPGKVVLLQDSAVEPGDVAYAQLFLSQPVAATWGQPFVIRSISPVETLGGGRVLDPQAIKLKRLHAKHDQLLEDLTGGDVLKRAAASSYFAGSRDWQPADWPVLAGVDDYDAVAQQLTEQQVLFPLLLGNGATRHLHSEVADKLFQRITKILTIEHHRTPLRKLVEQSRLAQHFRQVSTDLLHALCLAMQSHGELTVAKGGIAFADWSPQLSDVQQDLLQKIGAIYQRAQLQPPQFDQLAADLTQSKESITELLGVAVEAATLVRISKELLLHHEAERHAQTLLVTNMASGQALSVSQIRDLLGTSRKIAVPLCEHWDAIGFTQRQGDLRRLVTLNKDLDHV